MYLIALTGGIAAGKSVIGARLAELGAVHIDADELAREVVEPGEPALTRITEEFGPTVIGVDGALDRSALAAIVFSDPAKRALLNAITHPAVRARAKKLMAEAVARNPSAVVVYDVPLLIETGPVEGYDLVVVAMASETVRLRRLTEMRGMSLDEARGRIAAQATDEQRRAVADVVIATGGTMEETLAQIDELWGRVVESAASASRGSAHDSTSGCADGLQQG